MNKKTLFILSLLLVIFFWNFFFLGNLPIASDILKFQYLPWRETFQIPKNPLLSDPLTIIYGAKEYFSKQLREGSLTLWNPYIFCGTPLIGIVSPDIFHPFSLPGYLFSSPFAYALGIILRSFLAGLFMYLFLRHSVGLKNFSSLIGAVVFMLNGVFAVWLEFSSTVGGGLWFPLVFLLVDKIILRKSLLLALLAAIILHFTSRNLQFFPYLLVSLSVYALFRILFLKRFKAMIQPVFLIGGSVFLGILLSAFIILPLYEQTQHCHRQEIKFEELNPLPVANLATFVIPDFYGTPAPPHSYRTIRNWFYETGLIKKQVVKVGGENYNEYCGYIGVLPLILALLAGLLRKDRDSRFFFGFWIVSLLLALGTFLYLPLYWFAPGFNKMGISRIIFLFCFSGSILAGMGAERLTEHRAQSTEHGREGLVLRVTVWVLAIATLSWLIFLLLPKFNSQLSTLNSQLLAWHFSLKNPSMTIPILLALSSIIILFLSLKGKRGALLKGSILLVISFDLLYFGMKYNPMTPKEWLFPETPSLSFLTAKLEKEPPFRIIAFDRILPPNTNLVYRLQSVEGYESLHSARYHDFMKELVSPDVYHNWIDIRSRANRKFLQLLNVKYILADREFRGEDLELVYDGEIKICEDLKAYPRAWVVPEAKVLKTKEEIFEELRSPDFDPRKTVILEEGIRNQGSGIRDQQTRTKLTPDPRPLTPEIIDYQPEKVIIEADLPQAGFLVLSDSYYPGWKVFVDGEGGEVLRANYIMRAVKLSPGHHQVEFIYDPSSFKLGLAISLATLFLITILMVYALFKGFS